MSERDELKAFITETINVKAHLLSPDDFDYVIVDALIEAGYQKVPKDITWLEKEAAGYLSPSGILVISPIFEFEKAKVKKYSQVVGSTPWKFVEDDDCTHELHHLGKCVACGEERTYEDDE